MANSQSLKRFPILLAVLLGVLLALVPQVLAEGFLPLPNADNLDVPAPEGDSSTEKFGNVLGPLARNIRIIVGGVALLFIVVAGFGMVVVADNEESVRNQKKSITYAIIGLMMMSIAGPVSEVFDFREGNILEDPETLVERAALFDNATRLIVTFVKYLLGGLATLSIVSSGASMVTGAQNEETLGRAKKNLGLAAGGLLLVVVSDLVVRRVLFDASYNSSASETVVAINQNELVAQIVGFTNLLVTFVGPIMMLGLVIGGVMYIVAGGDEDRVATAKKIIRNSLIGVIIIYGAFSLVSTVITGVF